MPEECLNFLGGNELKPRENCLPSREPWPHRGRIEPNLLSHDVYGKQHHQGEPLVRHTKVRYELLPIAPSAEGIAPWERTAAGALCQLDWKETDR
jgi:hypothetical protein